MNATVRISERYNTGGYEHVDITVTVSGEIEDPEDILALHDSLDAVMHPARLRVAELTSNDSSMIHDHPALNGEEK